MARPDFTHERTGAQDSVGVDDYVVRGSDGEALGTVEHLLLRDGRRALVVESAAVPGTHRRRLVEWSEVDHVDHDALAVWLRLSRERFEALDTVEPAEEEGLGATDRVDGTPPELLPRADPEPAGPVDRTLVPMVIALGGALGFTALVVAAAATAFQTPWLYLAFVVPAVIAAVTIVVMLRIRRRPYEPRGAKKP
jgi:hypothetical protein